MSQPAAPQRPQVLHVGTSAPGGIRTVMQALMASQLAQGWDLQPVLSHAPGPLWHRLRLAAGAGWRIARSSRHTAVAGVHLHSAMRGSFWRKALYLRLAQWRGKRAVLHLHGSEMEPFYESAGSIGRWLIRRTLERADVTVVLSTSWQRFVHRVAPAARVRIVPNFAPVDPARDPTDRSPGERLRVVFLGQIGPRKGVFDLLAAIAAMPGDVRARLELVIGGDGEVAELNRRLAAMPVPANCRFVGWVDAGMRDALLRQAHLLVLPSRNEGLPMALLEAMAVGVPVLTTPVGGIPDLVEHGQNGILVQPGDVPALSDAVIQLEADELQRRVLARAAHARVMAGFSESHVVALWSDVYRSCFAFSAPRSAAGRSG